MRDRGHTHAHPVQGEKTVPRWRRGRGALESRHQDDARAARRRFLRDQIPNSFFFASRQIGPLERSACPRPCDSVHVPLSHQFGSVTEGTGPVQTRLRGRRSRAPIPSLMPFRLRSLTTAFSQEGRRSWITERCDRHGEGQALLPPGKWTFYAIGTADSLITPPGYAAISAKIIKTWSVEDEPTPKGLRGRAMGRPDQGFQRLRRRQRPRWQARPVQRQDRDALGVRQHAHQPEGETYEPDQVGTAMALPPFSFVLSGMFTVVHKDFAVPSKADMPQPPSETAG